MKRGAPEKAQLPPGAPAARKRVSPILSVAQLFGGYSFMLGVLAHFYLIFVASLATHFYFFDDGSGAAAATVDAIEEASVSLSGFAITVYVLAFSLVLLSVSYLLKWSWPVRSESALLSVLVWLLYSALVGNFGFCFCCAGNTAGWAAMCSTGLYENLYSIGWLLALVSSFAVDSRYSDLRRVSLYFTATVMGILFILPGNACSTLLPSASSALVLFLKITFFHIVWHSNRLQRIAEGTLYGMYLAESTRLRDVRVVAAGDARGPGKRRPRETERLSLNVSGAVTPHDLSRSWTSVMAVLAELQGREEMGRVLLAKAGREAGDEDLASLQLQQHLDALRLVGAQFTPIAQKEPWVDWRYRDYHHRLLFVIDIVRTSWILSVCWPYVFLSVLETAWIWRAIWRSCSDIIVLAEQAVDTSPLATATEANAR